MCINLMTYTSNIDLKDQNTLGQVAIVQNFWYKVEKVGTFSQCVLWEGYLAIT